MRAQGIENIRVPRLPFSKKNKKGDRTRALASVEALRNWAKAQAVMLYGGMHPPLFPLTCDKQQVSLQLLVRSCSIASKLMS